MLNSIQIKGKGSYIENNFKAGAFHTLILIEGAVFAGTGSSKF